VDELGEIDRNKVRAAFERRFSVEIMAKNYVSSYMDVLTRQHNVVTMPRTANGRLPRATHFSQHNAF
jgi:hypothetical protein